MINSHQPVLSLLSYEGLSRKLLFFKSFTGLTVQQFDNIYDKDITKRYVKHEIQRLSKKYRKRDMGVVVRHFKLDTRERFLMLLAYYRLYITYILTDFLFNLDQRNICRDIQKIEGLTRQCVPIPEKTYQITDVSKSNRGSREIFSWLH